MSYPLAARDAFVILARYKRRDGASTSSSEKAVEGPSAGYAPLNRAALAVLAPGGLLVTASCGARVSADALLRRGEGGRQVNVVGRRGS